MHGGTSTSFSDHGMMRIGGVSFVVGLTAIMIVVEIVGGIIFGSMALVADGWHMSTHAGALAIAALAYRVARRHAHNERFAFEARLGPRHRPLPLHRLDEA